MALSYYDKRTAKVEIMGELKKRGWKVYGYKQDKSDPMTDYFDPASWDGIAEKDGYIILIDICKYDLGKSGKKVTKKSYTIDHAKIAKLQATINDSAASENEKETSRKIIEKMRQKEEMETVVVSQYPVFKHVNPGRTNWHIEKDGEIIAKGNRAFSFFSWNNKEESQTKLVKFIDGLENKINEQSKLIPVKKQVVKKIVKPVSIDLTIEEAQEGQAYLVIDKPLTYGVQQGYVYKLTRKQTFNGKMSVSFVRMNKKLNKELTGSSNPANTAYFSESNFKRLFEKGCFHFAELKEVEEVTEKTVYVKAKRDTAQKENLLTGESVETTNETAGENAQGTTEKETAVTYTLNEEKNGVEIRFSSKPSEEVREQMKAAGFRWSRYSKCWYAKQSDSTISLAKKLSSHDLKSQENAFEYPEIDIDDVETYVIDQTIQDREHDAHWIFRTTKRDHTKEIQNLFNSWNDEVKKLIKTTDNQSIIYHLKKDLQRFKKRYYDLYLKYLTSRGNNPSWAVTGRAGRSMNRYNKLVDRENAVMLEFTGIPEEFKNKLSEAKDRIRHTKKEKIKKLVSKINNVIEFKAENKEFTFMNNLEKKRVYTHGDWFICKICGAFRIFYKGKEVHTMLTTETLNDAKKYATYLISQHSKIS
ncbi:hypothetical protein CHCC20491_1837 [Bacillus paralicheniformis]|uniref:hypothetical protein n=1 Tax=Bacillus subtilis group TaxID=653685 RepID=UPI000682E33A|nr:MULTISPECIES: hypothetical protein [Bacillus subtilis group]KND06199.1 hypothetical protein ACJ43_17670 [Bacillus paralicheniformis]MCY9239062.1 hypothetical protein [Bacillus licheniformis]TWN93186.1 hypothetical protein CHCC20491_1837 [Bacillus paralicheniformis]